MRKKPNVVLGVSFGHGDSSAALIVNGVLVAAVEEERFNRVKHYALFPHAAIEYCLAHANLTPADVDVIAIPRKPSNQLFQRLALYVTHPHLLEGKKVKSREESLGESIKKAGLSRARVYRCEHHLAHLFSTRYLLPKDECAYLSFDGLGDFVSTSIGKVGEKGLEIIDRVLFPHSLGFFYTALTQYLGFPHYGDEFKVMGLSSYGEPTYLDVMRSLIREKDNAFGFELNLEAFPALKKPIPFSIEKGQPKTGLLYNVPLMTHLIGFAPRKAVEPLTRNHWNLAKSTQVRFEEIGFHLLKQLHSKVPCHSVVLSGGCAHNSVWVGKIPANTEFKKVAVAPAAHDAGLAVGAAIAASDCEVSAEGGNWALLGPTPEELQPPKSTKLGVKNYKDENALIHFLVDQLEDGRIVGLCNGRLEFGPRALGSRSILADPRSATMKDKLNARVKHREAFRPFAASVLEEHQGKWFEDSFYTPSMEAVFIVREGMRKRIPAVTHVDGTCRIQSVSKDTQPFYWKLLEAFRKKTSVPMLLNTSFNDSEPIVCSAKDAIRCFENSEMDFLVIGLSVYTKSAKEESEAA